MAERWVVSSPTADGFITLAHTEVILPLSLLLLLLLSLLGQH